ncbi:MAG TPA: ATP synthase F1 subunit delta [Vicinamibacterales bacterium]|jgi:F-type H+-transporting ATPase subunit delta|nr:ATP synthase F1 subunit delta [Vicinamibacterales bacterium]
MPSRASAARYARALFDVALKESDPAQIERDLAAFVALMSENGELHGALTNPAIPASAKHRIVDALAQRLTMAKPAHKLLLLLADRDRLGLAPQLLDVYRERLMEHQQVVRAEVTTAAPLSPERLAALQQKLASVTGRKIDMKTSVDPSIIGGVVTRIGSTVYDGSIASQLAKLREKLSV